MGNKCFPSWERFHLDQQKVNVGSHRKACLISMNSDINIVISISLTLGFV